MQSPVVSLIVTFLISILLESVIVIPVPNS